MRPLTIHGWGAVTPVGLTVAQTCAAIRAGICAYREIVVGLPPEEQQLAAPVPAKWRLRTRPAHWLSSLASRAIAECLRDEAPDPIHTVLIVVQPEEFRGHPASVGLKEDGLIARIESRLAIRFHQRSGTLGGGPAAVYAGLRKARTLFDDPTVHYCIVGGVDSLINDADMTRLRGAGRLRDPRNPQGLVPGEGASFLLVSPKSQWQRFRPLAQVLGIATAMEPDTVLGSRYSVGNGLRTALSEAVEETEGGEPSIAFVASTFNGERYGAWEALFARPRFYRTRRERINVMCPAMSVGEIGTAAPALAIMVAAMAMARGYAPGNRAMCEVGSDEGLRGACVVDPSPAPPAFVSPGKRAGEH